LGGVIAELNLPITLVRSATPLGKDQEIDRFVKEETLAAIPEVKDQELVRFRIKTEPGEARTIVPYFRNSGGTQDNTYQAAGFSNTQARTLTQGLARSMYIFELYDDQDSDTQVLLSRAFCKGDDANTYEPVFSTNGVLTSNKPLLRVVSTGGTPTTISPLALPLYFLRKKPSGTVYLRVAFFNSTTGKKVRMRRRLTGLSIADNNYIPLVYDATSRLYHMPTGTSVDIEEVPTSVTSAEAEAERKKRIANMETTPRLGVFQPLGPPEAITFFTTTGITSTNSSTTGTTSGGTVPATVVYLDVPATTVPTKVYRTLSQAHLALLTEPATSVKTTTGILTVGLPVFRTTLPLTQIPDGWWAYQVTGSSPPTRVFRVMGGIITQLNVPNPDIVNVIQVPGTAIDPTMHSLSRTACNAGYDIEAATGIYASNGALQTDAAIYTLPNLGGRLTDGYYKYSPDTASPEVFVLRIQYDVVVNLDVSCNTGGHVPANDIPGGN